MTNKPTRSLLLVITDKIAGYLVLILLVLIGLAGSALAARCLWWALSVGWHLPDLI